MLLPDAIIQIEDLSGVSIYCDPTEKQKVKEDFEKIFREKWDEAIVEACSSGDYGVEICLPDSKRWNDARRRIFANDSDMLDEIVDDDEAEDTDFGEEDDIETLSPEFKDRITDTDYGFSYLAGSLALRFYCNECTVANPKAGVKAFKAALTALKGKYPAIEYYAYVGFHWHDEHCGDNEQDEFSSATDCEADIDPKEASYRNLVRELRKMKAKRGMSSSKFLESSIYKRFSGIVKAEDILSENDPWVNNSESDSSKNARVYDFVGKFLKKLEITSDWVDFEGLNDYLEMANLLYAYKAYVSRKHFDDLIKLAKENEVKCDELEKLIASFDLPE